MRECQKEEQVQVKTTVPVQKWKWVSGVSHRRLGPLTYLARVGKRIWYCHADHSCVVGHFIGAGRYTTTAGFDISVNEETCTA